MRQSAQRSRSANDSGRGRKETTGGLKRRAGMSGGKHSKNKIYTGGAAPKRKRHPGAKARV